MAAATSSSESIRMGPKANDQPAACTAGPPMTDVSAAAPPGGCRQRRLNMAPMASAVATDASTGCGSAWPSQRTQAAPTRAETTLPPMTDQGWASGLAGRQNSSTDDAPIGATSQMAFSPSSTWATMPVIRRPRRAPQQARSRSAALAVPAAGTKAVKKDLESIFPLSHGWVWVAGSGNTVIRGGGGKSLIMLALVTLSRDRAQTPVFQQVAGSR